MYIKRIYLKNIRCFKDKTVEFKKKGISKLFCGDNGEGKSTFLKAIAMGLCDQASAAALHRELPGEFIRDKAPKNKNGYKEGAIDIELADGRNRYNIVTTLVSLEAFEEIKQQVRINGELSESRDFPWKKLFVSGYGAGIRAAGTSDFRDYVPVDSVYPLFRYDVPLQNPELAFRRITTKPKNYYGSLSQYRYSKKVSKHVKGLLLRILDLQPTDEIELTETGLDLVRGGETFELNSQGDGHKAMSTLILDLLSWWMIYVKLNDQIFLENLEVQGIVLIDEVEQHLHPRWQIRIMKLLKEQFPGVQFIITTHSPLVISGCDQFDVYRVTDESDHPMSVYGWLAEDVYDWMGLESSRAPAYVHDTLRRFEHLDEKRLRKTISKTEHTELRRLRKVLKGLPSTDIARLTVHFRNYQKLLRRR